jgi:hypothetical protein
VSSDFSSRSGGSFVDKVAHCELLHNAMMTLIAPELHSIGEEAVMKLKRGEQLFRLHENVERWPSIFSAFQVIVNRITPPHRDSGSAPAFYDLLTSAGSHKSCTFRVCDMDFGLSYAPGTVIAVAGKILKHEVAGWEGGERICIAHYMRDNVLDCLGLQRSKWVEMNTYWKLMGKGFLKRHGMPV